MANVYEVTRVRIVTEVCTVEAYTPDAALRRAFESPPEKWRVREQEVLSTNTCQVQGKPQGRV